MIAWLRVFFHHHKWEVLRTGVWGDKRSGARGNYYDCRCSECGRIKEFRT